MPTDTCKWVAGLSNGETAIEGRDRFEEIQGELSPWQKLQSYIAQNKLEITSLKIRVYSDNNTKDFNLPSNKPKFGGEIPIDFDCWRKVIGDVNTSTGNIDIKEKYLYIQALYPTFTVELWVDELDTNQSWVSVKMKQ